MVLYVRIGASGAPDGPNWRRRATYRSPMVRLDLLALTAAAAILTRPATSVRSMVKKRRDSAEQYQAGGREDLVAIELSEVEVIVDYLPQALSAEEVEAIVKEAIAEVEASSMADMGKVMKAVQPKAAGRADGKVLSETVRRLLG